MPVTALGLVLVAAVFHATWNLVLHQTQDRPATMAVAGILAGAFLLPTALVAPPWPVLLLAVCSAVAECAYALCLSAAYHRGALALTYPIGRGTAPLLVTLGSWLIYADVPAPVAIGGAVALAIGLGLIAMNGVRLKQIRAVAFALLVGCAIATYSLIDSHAVRQVSPVSYLGLVMALQGLLLVAWLRADRTRLRQAFGPGIRVAIGSTAAYLLVLLAFQQAAAGRVATLREISVLIGLILAREKHGWPIWLGAALVVTGAILTAA